MRSQAPSAIAGDEWQVARVERGVRVHEADDVVLGAWSRPSTRAEAPHRRADDIGTELGGESGRAVVDPLSTTMAR